MLNAESRPALSERATAFHASYFFTWTCVGQIKKFILSYTRSFVTSVSS